MGQLDPRSELKSYLITQEEFDALPEYSFSRPTGAVDGTMWKCYRQASPNGVWIGCWIVCEFSTKFNLNTTYFYMPVFVKEKPEGERRVWIP